MARAAPVHRILADAARSDEDAASLLAQLGRQRQEGQRRIARSLARSNALRPGLRERDAADIIYALASPEVYGLLVFDRRWGAERYEKWMNAILIDQLLSQMPQSSSTEPAGEEEPNVCYLITSGRKTGHAHTIEIWFTGIDSTFYLISGGRESSDWVKNLLSHPVARVRLHGESFPVMARLPIGPSPERDQAITKLHGKYQRHVSGSLEDWLRDAYIVALDREQ
jgi:deazaflavin-dependent oxidoreductase (nitroreductase family)